MKKAVAVALIRWTESISRLIRSTFFATDVAQNRFQVRYLRLLAVLLVVPSLLNLPLVANGKIDSVGTRLFVGIVSTVARAILIRNGNELENSAICMKLPVSGKVVSPLLNNSGIVEITDARDLDAVTGFEDSPNFLKPISTCLVRECIHLVSINNGVRVIENVNHETIWNLSVLGNILAISSAVGSRPKFAFASTFFSKSLDAYPLPGRDDRVRAPSSPEMRDFLHDHR